MKQKILCKGERINLKKYFKLHPYVKAVNGKQKCAIYNLLKGEVFSITQDKYDMLSNCENGVPLNEINGIDYSFISDLKTHGLGLDYENNVFINKNFYGFPQAVNNTFEKITLNRLFIEITNECNLNCKFCKEDNILFRKTGCKRWPSHNRDISLEEWKKIILEAKNLGCKNFLIMGGEPLLEFDKLKQIVSYICDSNANDINIIVYTNGVLLNDEKIKYVKQNNISLCIQVLSDNNLTYKKISESINAFDKISNSLIKLKENNVPYNLLLLVSRFNDSEIERILKKFKYENIKLEFIYPIKNDFYSEKYINAMYDKSKNFVKPSLSSFDSLSKYNNCFKNSLAVSCDGSIYPCIMSRKLNLGNIKNLNLVEAAIKSEKMGYSTICKDKVEGCKLCHKRYGCLDCRALEMSATDSILGMKFCNVLLKEKHCE